MLVYLFVLFCFNLYWSIVDPGFPGGTVVKLPPANTGGTGDKVSIPGLGRSPGEGNGNSLKYSYLGNPMDKGAWRATAHGVTESDTAEAA